MNILNDKDEHNKEAQRLLIKPAVMPHFFIRSFTNDKERAKQYFTVAKSDNYSEALIIRKLVLPENLKLYGGNSKIIKQFKDYYLFEQRFSIKIETLKIVMSVLNVA